MKRPAIMSLRILLLTEKSLTVRHTAAEIKSRAIKPYIQGMDTSGIKRRSSSRVYLPERTVAPLLKKKQMSSSTGSLLVSMYICAARPKMSADMNGNTFSRKRFFSGISLTPFSSSIWRHACAAERKRMTGRSLSARKYRRTNYTVFQNNVNNVRTECFCLRRNKAPRQARRSRRMCCI